MSFSTRVKTGVCIIKTSKRERLDLESNIPNKRSKIDNESPNFEGADQLWGDEVDDFTQDDIESIDTIIASQQCTINKPENSCNIISKNDAFNKTNLPATSLPKQNNNTIKAVYAETFKRNNSQIAEKGDSQLLGKTITNNQNLNKSVQLEKLRLENEEKSKEIEKLRQGQFSKDGQVKMLRESLAQKETELQRLKQERVNDLEVQTCKQSDREKKLSADVEKLITQMQFKEQELLELQNAHRKLEKQHMGTGVDSCRSPMGKHVSPSTSATNLHKLSPKSVFPTKETFMVRRRSKCDTPNVSGSIDKDKQTPSKSSQTRKSRLKKNSRMQLLVSGSKGCVSGSKLVGRMLQTAGTTSNDSTTIGDIFHSSQTRFQKTTTDTEALMGPAGAIPNVSAPVTSTEPLSYAIVDPASQKYRLARQSLSLMLSSTKIDNKDIRKVLCSCTESAVLCLPAIENHVTNYRNVLQTVMESQFASPPTGALSNRGSPTSASLESMTSSFDSLLNDEYSVLETCGAKTLKALQILEVLVDYSYVVRAALLTDAARASQQEMHCEEETAQRKSLDIATTKDPLVSSSFTSVSSVSLDSTISHVISESNLLQQLIKLANPCIFKKKLINLPVTQIALQILSRLSQSAKVVELDSLEPLIIEDALYNCLKQQGDIIEEYQSSLAYAALDLVTDLIQSPKLVSKLTLSNSDNSLLQEICRLGIRPPPSLGPDQKTALAAKVIFMLSNILSQEKSGWACLAGKDNAFCTQILKAVVLSLHREYRYYRENPTAASLQLLRKGVLVLHTLFTQDAEYNKHYHDIHHEYVEVICGLDNLYREISEVCDQEVSAIQELWDFEQEYPENSADDQDAEDLGEDIEMSKTGSQR